MPYTTVSAQWVSPLPTAITNNYHTSSLYSIGRLCYHEDLCCLKPSVLNNQEKAVDPQVGLTFQRSGSSHCVLGTPKGRVLGCWGMELKRGSQKLRPWIWGETGMSWVQSIIRRELQGCYPMLEQIWGIMDSSFYLHFAKLIFMSEFSQLESTISITETENSRIWG